MFKLFILFIAAALACTNYKVTCSTLNVRSGPGTNFSIKTTYAKGKIVCVDSITSSGWAKLSNGYYVSSGYLQKDSTTQSSSQTCTEYYNTVKCNIRVGPSTSYTIKGATIKGAKYCVYGSTNGWYKIKYAGITCYALGKYFSKTAPTQQTTTNTNTVPGTPRDISNGAANNGKYIKEIWDYLYSQIGNKYGTAGLMGNLKAESGFNPCNLQDSYETLLGYTDSSYTYAIDQGKYDRFGKDSAGYGLAQWTYGKRKLNLLAYADEKKTSIGNLRMQMEFLVKELKASFSSVWKTLQNATSVSQASNAVLLKFEMPADQSTTKQKLRASYGQTIYDTYAK